MEPPDETTEELSPEERARLAIKVRHVLEDLRAAGKLAPTALFGPDRDRQEARRQLDNLPPNGELYWHGEDGRPCPCSSCVKGWTRFLDANGLIDSPNGVLRG